MMSNGKTTQMEKPLPSKEYLRECFTYDYETGQLTWKVRPESHFKAGKKRSQAHTAAIWNSQFSGTVAGTPQSQGYCSAAINGSPYQAHRLIWCWVTGDDPGAKHVDHLNQQRGDNRFSNLRLVNRNAENSKNQGRRRDNNSGVTGVSWFKETGKWRSVITLHRKQQHLGLFDDFDAAVAARKAAEREYGFHPNHGAAKAA